MLKIFFTNKEIALLKKIEKQNDDELLSWKLPNLIFPLIMVVFSIAGFICFKKSELVNFKNVVNLLLNGSLLMFALNRTSSIGVNLFKFDKSKEKRSNENTYNLRLKINDYTKMLSVGIMFLYIYQIVNTPFSLSFWILFQILLLIIVIYYSVVFSKFSYFLQERLFERTVGDDIRDEAAEGKKHLNEKYGE